MKLDNLKLEDLVVFQRGFDITVREQATGKVPVISSSGISSFHDKYKVEGPGIVIGRKGTLGTVFYSEENFWPHDTTLWVKDFKGNDPKFIYYFLKTLKLERFDAGASNPTLNRNHIHKLRVQVPKVEFRSKIASILSNYDELIENNNQRIALLEQIGEEIYTEWFVRLRFPGYENTPILDGVPKGWKLGKVHEILELQRGFDLPIQSRDAEGNVPVLASTDIVGYHSESKVAGPGIVTGRSGTIGKVLYVKTDFWPLNTTLWVKKYLIGGPLFALQFLQTLNLEKLAGGAAVPSLDRKLVHAISVTVPPSDIVNLFESLVQPIHNQIEILQLQNESLKQTRDLLLPRLISGKLSVEHLVEEQQLQIAN